MSVPETIECVECGELAYRLTGDPELGWEAGDIAVYRCSGCAERFDVVGDASDLDDGAE